MNELYIKDWKYILDTTYRINAIKEVEALQFGTLKFLRFAIPYLQGLFHIYKEGHDNNGFVFYNPPVWFGTKPLYLDEFSEKYASDIFFSRTSVATCDEVFRDTDVFPDELRVQTDWYQDIYAKQGIHYALRCQLTYGGNLIGSIDLFRAKDDVDFSDREVSILENLARHIALKLKMLLDDAAKSQSRKVSDGVLELASKHRFTPRECEVAAEMSSGITDEKLAQKLCVSKSTLKKHIHNIYKKMGVHSRAQFMAALHCVE